MVISAARMLAWTRGRSAVGRPFGLRPRLLSRIEPRLLADRAPMLTAWAQAASARSFTILIEKVESAEEGRCAGSVRVIPVFAV